MCKDHAARRSLALEARDAGWSVRETERRAREAEGQPQPESKRFTRTIHPDLAEALAAAEDTLATALGQPVKVRPRGDGCRVELDFESPADAVALAERVLARGHLRAV
jgi:ParB family chromosome partitioning protein